MRRPFGRLLKSFANGSIPVRDIAAQLGSGRAAAPRSLLRQGVRFGTVGVISTLAYLLIFSALHAGIGSQAANLVPLLVTAIGNTAVNRRFTFGVRGSDGALRHHLEGLAVFTLALAVTSASLFTVPHLVDATPHWLELSVLLVANLTATVLRFTLLRGWVFHPNRD
jgi:putative flippase GtrA